MDNAKSYAKNVLDGYADTLKRLAERYASAIQTIDNEHNMIRKEINDSARRSKSSADASNKVSLHNTKSALLDKGLSRSGASVQSDISHNLARNNAFSSIETNAAKERAENENARAKAKASAFTDYIDKVNTAEQKKNEAYIAQLNADRDYEAERDDEKFDRYVENREYEAERDDERFDRYVENREYEAERDDEKYDRYADNRDYEAKRSDEAYDRYADSRDYEADRNDEKYDRYADNRDYEAGRDDESFDRKMESDKAKADGTSGDYTGITPNISPSALVDSLFSGVDGMYMKESEYLKVIKKKVEIIIEDQALAPAYRYEVKIYAKALGLI